MDDDLIDTADLPLRRRSLLPGTGFFYPDSLDDERREERARETIEGAETVVIADSDADGLGCVALIREAYGAAVDPGPYLERIDRKLDDDASDDDASDDEEIADEKELPTSSVALVPSSPHALGRSLDRVAEYAEEGIDLFVCDLCPDEYDTIASSIETLVGRCERITWYDHHQWEADTETALRDAGVELVVGDSESECTADVALRSLEYAFDDRFADLAAVTRDHDLWVNDDPRSADLADFAYWSRSDAYVAIVGEYGADLPEPAMEYVEERRIEKEQLIELAVDRAAFESVGEWTVGITYGRCSQNEVAEALRSQGADAAVIVKPSGSASIRGTEAFERCHEVASQVNGGGHPRAAGCKPAIYDDMLDYAQHWVTEGAIAQRRILTAFERLLE